MPYRGAMANNTIDEVRGNSKEQAEPLILECFPMSRIFLSYRRDDTQDVAGRIFDALVDRFSGGRVFKDIDSVPLGTDFRAVLQGAIEKADVVLVLIGPKFLTVTDAKGQRRIDDPSDFVRIEIETAIRMGKPIIPIIIGSAAMVAAEDLPPPLQKLAFQNGLKVRPDPDFHVDMNRLTSAIEPMSPELANSYRIDKKTRQRRFLFWGIILGVTLGVALGGIMLTVGCSGMLALFLADDFGSSIKRVDDKGDEEMKSLEPSHEKFDLSKANQVDKKNGDGKSNEFDKPVDGERDKLPKAQIVTDEKGNVTEINIGGGKKRTKKQE